MKFCQPHINKVNAVFLKHTAGMKHANVKMLFDELERIGHNSKWPYLNEEDQIKLREECPLCVLETTDFAELIITNFVEFDAMRQPMRTRQPMSTRQDD